MGSTSDGFMQHSSKLYGGIFSGSGHSYTMVMMEGAFDLREFTEIPSGYNSAYGEWTG
jgi:hypothetical protein